MRLPEIIYFKITSKCNHNCRYCYDSACFDDLNLDELKKIIKFLSTNGVKGVAISGGEPLIRPEASEILEEIKSHQIKIYLDTNGDFFAKHKEAISKYVNVLGLPIDSPSEEGTYRDEKNFKNILKILEYYSNKTSRPEIRVGTVATKENISQLKEICDLIKKYDINMWKIYQFLPIGPNAKKNRESLEISKEEFQKELSKLESEKNLNFKIVASPREKRKGAYFFIDSDGSVFIPNEDSSDKSKIHLGSVFDSDIVSRWENFADKQNYFENAELTFNHKFNK